MRIRTVKPEVFNHDELHDLEVESGLPVIRCFIGLWCASDREGRFKWRAKALKSQIAPYDTFDFSDLLDHLWRKGFVLKYSSGGEIYGQVKNFSRHQVINNRERDSDLPGINDPGSETLSHCSHACDSRGADCSHAASGEGKGREGKGKEGKGTQQETRDEASKQEQPFTSPLQAPIVEHQTHPDFTGIAFADQLMPKVPMKTQDEWLKLYPDPAFWHETIREIHAWLVANPSRAWKNYPRGVGSWLKAAWFKWERRPQSWQDRNRQRILDMKNPFEDQS